MAFAGINGPYRLDTDHDGDRADETVNDLAAGFELTGVDIADGLLDAAREISAHIDPPVTFIKADAANLPFPDAHFDRAVV